MRGQARATWILLVGLAWLYGSSGCTSEDGKGDESNEASASSEDEAPTTDPDTGASPACEPRPVYPELYSSCTGMGSCGGDGRVCAYQAGADPTMDPAYCTTYCTFDVECPAVGTCSATPLCITQTGGGTGVCALDCADDKQCPTNLLCLEDIDNGSVRHLCF